MKKTSYNTPARKALIEFFKSNKDNQFTSKEVSKYFSYNGAPGKSTVYRQLAELCRDGIVKRYSTNVKTPLYQYFSEGECSDHFHMKCTLCGKLFHLECHEMSLLAEHISHNHKFSIDRKNTVILGQCDSCFEGENT
ncbi:MAG: transcriptional repressor [Clostridia bacterium]|nr:transcriptional repressor [Clostridia bacterium]